MRRSNPHAVMEIASGKNNSALAMTDILNKETMKKIRILLLAAGIFISSCSMPATGMSDAQISTAAALTVQAALDSAAAASTSTPQPLATSQFTPTPEYAMASVSEVINCRSGPGTNYDRVAQILPGEPVKIVGFFSPNYWVVSTVNGECWLSGEFSTPSGNFAAVPTVTAPPTPQGGSPDAPTFSKNGWTWFCYGDGNVDIELTWNDNSKTEKGYRIYRNGELATELPENSTFFKETTPYPGGEGLTYRVEAFNEAGTVSSPTDTLFCE